MVMSKMYSTFRIISAGQIASIVEPEVTAAEIKRASRRPSVDLTVWQLNSRAEYESGAFSPDSLLRAKAFGEQALALDPENADSCCALAQCHAMETIYGWNRPAPGSDENGPRRSEQGSRARSQERMVVERLGPLQILHQAIAGG